jgi:hypothetical protein
VDAVVVGAVVDDDKEDDDDGNGVDGAAVLSWSELALRNTVDTRSCHIAASNASPKPSSVLLANKGRSQMYTSKCLCPCQSLTSFLILRL